MRKTNRAICAALAVFGGLALCASAYCGQVAVIPEKDAYVDLVFDAGAVEQSKILIDGDVYTQLYADGCFTSGEPGEPAVLKKEITVGVPLDAAPTFEIIDVRTKELARFLLVPVPETVVDSLGFESYIYKRNAVSYGRPGLAPAGLVQMGTAGFMRNQRVVRVLISVVRYDASRQIAEACEHIQVRVRFNRTGLGQGSSVPGDGFERVYRSSVANYDQAKMWRKSQKVSLGGSGLGTWLKMSLMDEGLYKLTYEDLKTAGVPVDMVDPRTFYLVNGGSKPLPDSLPFTEPDSTEVSLYVSGEEDGRMDPTDYLLFYAVSLTGWTLDTTSDSVSYFLNPYATSNVYWLRWGGQAGPRMDSLDATPDDPDPHRPATFVSRIHLEEEMESPQRSGLRWIWYRLAREGKEDKASFSTQFGASGGSGVASEICEVRMGFFVELDTVTQLRVLLNDDVVSDQAGPRQSGKNDPAYTVSGTAHSLANGRNDLKVELVKAPGADSSEAIYIDFFEIRYSRDFTLSEGRLRFSTGASPDPGTYEYRLKQAGGTPVIMDVTNPFRPTRLTNFEQTDSSEAVFQVDIAKTHVYSASNSPMKPMKLELDSPYDLRSGGADYLAICYEGFIPAVRDFIFWRDSYISGIANPKALAVGITDVIDNFSWGVTDPTAIRNFLAWTLSRWSPQPTYCLFVGASTYDYKNNMKLASPKNFIPPHVEGYVVVSGNAFPEEENPCFDDWFAWLTPGDYYADMFLGRFDAVSIEEARTLALRAMNREKEKLLGYWRKCALLVADDQEPYSGDSQFTVQCETAARHIPADVDIVKTYMVEYPKVGEEKPDARNAMIDRINAGVLSGMFLGHGNIKQIAHEKVFRSPEDVDRLQNGRMLPIFFYGSCSVGLLDRPTASSMASLTSKGAYGGNLVSLGASRPTWGGPNADLGYNLFDRIYGRDSLRTAGEIIYGAKIASAAGRGEYYILYGDPGVSIVPPPFVCSLAVIPDSMVGLSQVTVNGFMSDSTYDGWAVVKAFDSSEMESDTSEQFHSIVNYELPGEPFYWGIVQVRDGRFTHTFRVPKIEAGSIREGKDGRVSVYVWNNTVDWSGAVDSLFVGGNSGPITDVKGPRIEIQYQGKDVADSSFVMSGAQITAILSDESGIYLGSRPDKVLRLVVNGDELNSVHLSDLFNYDQGTDTLGRLKYTLQLPQELDRDSLTFVASDNCLNRSAMSIIVRPVTADEMTISDVLNYPNPFDNDTYFSLTTNQPARITIKVYTIAGRLIKTLTGEFNSPGYQQIYWDGKDEDGDRPSNGVYLYKVFAETAGLVNEVVTSSNAEVIGKLLIVR
jgi:hypothetical protein